jgi:hypothetical protein
MFDFLVLGFAFCFSVLLPFAILSLRRTVRTQRQSIILDLQHMFYSKEQQGGHGRIVPSFEFVRNKYFSGLVEFDVVKSGFIRKLHNIEVDGTREPVRAGTPYFAFLVCSIPLVVLVFAFSVFAASIVMSSILQRGPESHLLPDFSHFLSPPLAPADKAILWVFVVAFLGGYLFAVRGLLRAVNNFDLSPGSFLSAALQLLLGVVTAVLIVAGGVNEALTGTVGVQAAVSASVVAAFVIGFVPELGLRTLYRAARLRHFKREKPGVYESFEATPIEVVDGIDSEIRSRLADFNIVSVQNLATANPIMLFVETPFGIYQSIDWVAQAQLFDAVGPDAVLKLWKLGIRTIFDLEKAVLAPGHTTPQLRQAVGRAVLADADEAIREQFGAQNGSLDDASIEALVRNKLDDLHVQRLRQITMRIEDHLGAARRRLESPTAAPTPPAEPPEAPAPAPNAANDGAAPVVPPPPVPNGEAAAEHGPRVGNGLA